MQFLRLSAHPFQRRAHLWHSCLDFGSQCRERGLFSVGNLPKVVDRETQIFAARNATLRGTCFQGGLFLGLHQNSDTCGSHTLAPFLSNIVRGNDHYNDIIICDSRQIRPFWIGLCSSYVRCSDTVCPGGAMPAWSPEIANEFIGLAAADG